MAGNNSLLNTHELGGKFAGKDRPGKAIELTNGRPDHVEVRLETDSIAVGSDSCDEELTDRFIIRLG